MNFLSSFTCSSDNFAPNTLLANYTVFLKFLVIFPKAVCPISLSALPNPTILGVKRLVVSSQMTVTPPFFAAAILVNYEPKSTPHADGIYYCSKSIFEFLYIKFQV